MTSSKRNGDYCVRCRNVTDGVKTQETQHNKKEHTSDGCARVWLRARTAPTRPLVQSACACTFHSGRGKGCVCPDRCRLSLPLKKRPVVGSGP